MSEVKYTTEDIWRNTNYTKIMASFATTESELEKQVPRIKPANTWAEPLQFRPTLTGGASRNACTPCRKVKMKCSPGVSSTVCARCQRKGLDCFFEQHRRGRKPGSKSVLALRNSGYGIDLVSTGSKRKSTLHVSLNHPLALLVHQRTRLRMPLLGYGTL